MSAPGPASAHSLPDSETSRLAAAVARLVADAVVCFARDGTVRWASPSSRLILGWDPFGVIGTRPALLVRADGVQTGQWLTGILESGQEVVRTRLRSPRADGVLIWSDVVAHVVHESDGAVACIVVSIRDVTADVERDADQREAERRFRVMAEHAVDVVFHTREGVTDWVSPSLRQVTGWDPEDLVGGTTTHLWHPDDLKTAIAMRDVTYSGQPARGELRFKRKDGSYVWVGVSLQPYAEGDGCTGAVGIMRDIDDLVDQRQRAEANEARLHALLDTMIDPFMLLSAVRDRSGAIVDFVVTEANPAALETYGVHLDQILGQRLSVLHPAVMATDLFAMYVDVIEMGRRLILDDWVFPRGARQEQLGRYDLRAVKVGDAVSQTWRDVSERHAASEVLARSEEHFRLLAENSTDVVLHDVGGTIKWVSPSVKGALGWETSDWIGRRFEDFTHPEDSSLADDLRKRMRAGENCVTTLRLRHAAGDYHWVEVHAGPYTGEGTQPAGIVASFRVVDREVEAHERLTAAEEQYRLLAQNSTDVVGHARNGRILWISPSVTRTLGGAPDDWIGMDVAEIIHPDDLPAYLTRLSARGQGLVGVVRARIKARDGNFHWIEANTGPFVNASGEEDGVIASFRVIDDLVEAESVIAHSARFDSLTGLMNRGEILQHLGGVARAARRPGEQTAVLFCDIDEFKLVNDAYGHAAGDEVLRRLAERISDTVRHEDAAARIGGDEFLVVLNGTHGLNEALYVAEKIRQSAAAAMEFDDEHLVATMSIGVTLLHPGESIGELLAHADEAMYEAKRTGRNRVVAFA